MSVIDELRRADFNNLGGLSAPAKGIFCALAAILILAAGYYFKTSPQREEFDQLVAQEGQLRAEFEEKQQKAANLEANIEQLEQMSNRHILDGVGELLTLNQKDWAKSKLREDTISMLRLRMEN